jgi:hypothetical protein
MFFRRKKKKENAKRRVTFFMRLKLLREIVLFPDLVPEKRTQKEVRHHGAQGMQGVGAGGARSSLPSTNFKKHGAREGSMLRPTHEGGRTGSSV